MADGQSPQNQTFEEQPSSISSYTDGNVKMADSLLTTGSASTQAVAASSTKDPVTPTMDAALSIAASAAIITETASFIADTPLATTDYPGKQQQTLSLTPPAATCMDMAPPYPGDYSLTLDVLPSEILLHICSFLDARFVVHTFSLVCKLFHQSVSEDIFWKVRIKKRWPKKYPPIPAINKDFNWKAACIEREERYRCWINPEENFDYFRFREGMSAPVDSVQLMQNGSRLAVGSRDQYLNILDVDRLDPADPVNSLKEALLLTNMNAHKGWIWSMTSLDTTLATGSWDMCIKFWDIAEGAQEISKVKCKSAVLCMHYEPNMMFAGCFDQKVYHIDPRDPKVLAEKRYHKKPVLAMAANNNYIMTASEDSTLVLYDRRADKVLRTLKLADFAMSMSYYDDQLWVGDKAGLVHLIDTSYGNFDIIETYNVGHHSKVSGIQYTLGALYTCSMDCTVRVHEPSAHPAPIATLSRQSALPTCLHYSDGILVTGCTDVSVGIWKPK